jgi:hypothetical protein
MELNSLGFASSHPGYFENCRRNTMSTISVRLSNSLHEKARELVKKEKVSINQLVTLALAEKISDLMTADYLEKRAKQGKLHKFQKALAKVADQLPTEEERI